MLTLVTRRLAAAVVILHAKVAVIDGQWATVGSSNLDALSLLLNLVFLAGESDAVFGSRMKKRILFVDAPARQVDPLRLPERLRVRAPNPRVRSHRYRLNGPRWAVDTRTGSFTRTGAI